MLRLIFFLVIISSCALNTIKTGGERTYVYNPTRDYTQEDLKNLVDKVVQTSKRDPHVGKLKDLFGKKQEPLKRIGIIVFETQIQKTLEGLSGENRIYLSESGKQIMTENFLNIWEQSLKIVFPELDYVPTTKIKQSKSFHLYGSPEEDFIKSRRSALAHDDIFFLPKGKKSTTTTTVNPRGMRDMSFLLVPANELMGGPKWSEQNKHFVNDVVKELELDAAIIVMSKAHWTVAHTDKHSGEHFPEELVVEVESTVLVPLSRYHERLEKLHINEKPNLTLAYRTYKAKVKNPVSISVSEDQESFNTIEERLTIPLYKTYKDISQMMIMKLSADLKKTW